MVDMDKETKNEFAAIHSAFVKESKNTQKQFKAQAEQFERLAIMVAEGFADVHKRIDFVHSSLKTEMTEMRLEFKADSAELRDEIRSIRADIAKLPDDVDETYSKTINDLLDRVTHLEKKMNAVELAGRQ
jgi:phosphoglycerate-specific signal transduction histidine kinase